MVIIFLLLLNFNFTEHLMIKYKIVIIAKMVRGEHCSRINFHGKSFPINIIDLSIRSLKKNLVKYLVF